MARVDARYASVLYRCEPCGFRLAPKRSAHELRELYVEEYFEEYGGADYREDEAGRQWESQLRREWIAKHKSSGRVLEIGAAAGYFLDEMRKSGYEVHGVEPAAGIAEGAINLRLGHPRWFCRGRGAAAR